MFKVFIDPDNLFWAIHKNSRAFKPAIPSLASMAKPGRKVISLYGRVKQRLDAEMEDFRFNSNLSAVYINPTDRCNANCPYCYIPAKTRKNSRSMTKDELEYIFEKIRRYFKNKKRKPVIVFHASEPLLVKELIFDAISKYSGVFKFGLQTNAILLEEKDVEFLEHNRTGVGISLDSYLPSINNRLRPARQSGGNFEKAVQAIEWFDGYKGLNVITTITKFNVTGLPEMVKFLHSKKVPCVLLNPVRITQKPSYNLKPDEKLLIKYFIKAVDAAIELSRNYKHQIIIGNFSNVILGIVAPTARRLMCDISPCGGGRCFLTITASGEMLPCGEFIGLKGFSGGNIFKTDIHNAMQSKPFKAIRNRIVEKIEGCAICVLRNICGAPCPAELYSLGDMYQPSIFCEFYKEIIKYAFKIIADGKEKYCFREDGLRNLEHIYRL